MNKNRIIIILFFLVGIIGFGSQVRVAQVNASPSSTYYVSTTGNDSNDGSSWATAKRTIENAVLTASSDDTIRVADGIYTENITVNKSLTIRSENGPVNCIVQTPDSGQNVFTVTSDNVSIIGFTVENANGCEWDVAGIYLSSANFCVIENVIATNNYYGIWLESSSSDTIISNTANSNSRFGIYLYSSSSNNLTWNTANLNNCGINLESSSSNNLTGNMANLNNSCGINIEDSNTNTLTKNTANSNSWSGFAISGSNNYLGLDTPGSGNTANFNRGYGIRVSDSGNHFNYNTANSNTGDGDTWTGVGIYLTGNSNTLTHNTVSFNSLMGIRVNASTGNSIASNIVSSNPYGIYFLYSPGNTLTNNTMSGNTFNLYVEDPYYNQTTDFNNSIDTTNTVEGKPVYYFYDHSDETYTDNDIGMFWCIKCDNVKLTPATNTTLADNNWAGVYFRETTGSTIQNITIPASNQHGIFLRSSTSNNITENTIKSAAYGIYLTSSSDSNNITYNTIFRSASAFYDSGTNTYEHNNFLYNLTSPTEILSSDTEVGRVKTHGESVDFTIEMYNPDGSVCDNPLTYSVTTDPSETFTPTKTDNQLTGTFTPTKPGIYSLLASFTDSNSNTTRRNYLFFVDALGSEITRYYVRGLLPSHAQMMNNANDIHALLFDSPTDTDLKSLCSDVILHYIDQMPDYPLANLSNIYVNGCYKMNLDGPIGFQRYVLSPSLDVSSTLTASINFTPFDRAFSDLNWGMDYPYSWYRLSSLLISTPSGVPQLSNTPSQPSYAEFTCQYTTTPAIKSISNPDIIVLSATAPLSDTEYATIVLDGTGTTDTSTNIVLDNYNRPFIGYTTIISSDGTATLQAEDITDTVIINSVRLDITPFSDSVDVDINVWTGYYKEWEETASAPDVIAEHRVGDLAPSNYYSVTKDGVSLGLYLSDSSGQITFTAPAGSVFSIVGLNTVFQTDGDDDDDGKSWCFIATATFGTPMANEVRVLSRFRDKYLLTNPIGEGFVRTYYKLSPHIALFITEHPILKKIVRSTLNPIIWMSGKSVE